MNNNDNNSGGFIIFLLIASLMLCVYRCNHQTVNVHGTSDTTYIYDTIIKPVPVHDTLIRMDTIAIRGKNTMFEPRIIHDTLTDSFYVSVPITQKTYNDTLYHAVVSGFKPSLDTIIINSRTVTNTIIKTEKKIQRLGLGISTGYDPFNKQPSVTIGINYNIFGIK